MAVVVYYDIARDFLRFPEMRQWVLLNDAKLNAIIKRCLAPGDETVYRGRCEQPAGLFAFFAPYDKNPFIKAGGNLSKRDRSEFILQAVEVVNIRSYFFRSR